MEIVKQASGKVWKKVLARYVDFHVSCRRE